MTHAIMSDTDYKGICDITREKTGTTALLKSAEVAPAIRSIELSTTSLTLTVTTEAGATVTATKGSLSVSAVATDGTAVLKLKEAGEWTVTASLNGETSTVLVSVTDSYELTLDYFTVDPVFANNDWATIIKACQLRLVPSTWVVADQKPMTINGTSYAIDIIGKNHDDYADGSGKAPLTLQFHDCWAEKAAHGSTNSNAGGWESSKIRNTTLPEILALMPAEVQTGMREVLKLTNKGSGSTAVTATQDKMFLLSYTELRTQTSAGYKDEGVQYEYYAAGNPILKDTPANSWSGAKMNTRSPYIADSRFFMYITSSSFGGYTATTSTGFAPAFCF